MRRIALGLLMLYCFSVPWEYSLELGEPFGNVARVVGVLLLMAAVPTVLLRRDLRRPGLLQWLVLGLYVYFAGSYFWTVDQVATLEKMRAYFQVMLVVWVAWELVRTPPEIRGMLRAFVAGCWVLAALTIWNYASASGVAEQVRFAATGQDPNDVARLLDFGFPLAALLFATEDPWTVRLLAVGYLPVGLLGVLLTASRGGFAAALVALLGAATLLVSWRPRGASVIFAGLAVTAGTLWMFVPAESLERLATIPQEVSGGDWNDRLGIWTAGWRAFVEAPWLGYGAGAYSLAAKLAPGDTAHNTVLAVVVTGGLVGLAIFLGIVAAVGWAVSRTGELMRIALGTLLAVWAITAMVGSVEENRATWLLFAVMALAGRLTVEEPDAMEAIFSGVQRVELAAQVEAVR